MSQMVHIRLPWY